MTELNPKDADTYFPVAARYLALGTLYTAVVGKRPLAPHYRALKRRDIYTINKLKISVPAVARQAVYNGHEQDIRQCLSNYDPAYTDAAGYTALEPRCLLAYRITP